MRAFVLDFCLSVKIRDPILPLHVSDRLTHILYLAPAIIASAKLKLQGSPGMRSNLPARSEAKRS